MPIYEYACEGCGERFEYMQSMKDPPKTTCEECGGNLQKLISAAAFHLKGGGWYKDLYSSAKPGASKDSSGGDSGSKDKSTSESTSKPKESSTDKSGGSSGAKGTE